MNALTDMLQKIADDRAELHADHASSRVWTPDCHLVGLVGEAEFARVFAQPLDLNERPGGDGGVDFTLPIRMTVDVKTARKPVFLIEKEGLVVADIYVLAGYSDELGRAELLGWTTGALLAAAPIRDFGYGPNHAIAREELRPMETLRQKVMVLR